MAEWGKGDPRWIVEERPDATNPNNWHWKEKNATQWSKDKLNELLVGLKIENEQLVCEIKELKKCDGEASANNRKAKLVFLVSRIKFQNFYSFKFSTNGISKVNGKDRFVQVKIEQNTKADLKSRIYRMRMKLMKLL
jgi:activator of HSP90 ATPase